MRGIIIRGIIIMPYVPCVQQDQAPVMPGPCGRGGHGDPTCC